VYGVVERGKREEAQGIEVYQLDERDEKDEDEYIGVVWFEDPKEVEVQGYINGIRVQVVGKATLWLNKLIIEEKEEEVGEILPDHLLKFGVGKKLSLSSLLG